MKKRNRKATKALAAKPTTVDLAFDQFEAARKDREPPKDQQAIRIPPELIARSLVAPRRRDRRRAFGNLFQAAQPKPGVLPAGHKTLAMDEAITDAIAWASQALYNGAFWEGTTFLGYPYLAELAQRPEFRRISEVIATEMTRKWIELKSAGDEDKTDKIAKINAYLDRLRVKDRFREIAENDGFFGRAHLYIEIGRGTYEDRAELRTSIGGGRDKISAAKVTPDRRVERLQVVEPVWCYPSTYNSYDPLAPTWYNPEQWFVQGKEVHVSRLLTFVGREVPDLLKPAYQFGGLALSQMAQPYVENWLRTRQSVSDLIAAFSVMVLSTNMTGAQQDGGADLMTRVDLFNNLRDNRNTMVIDKNTEDFRNVTTPLGTLDALQAQSQEHICSVSAIPVVKYTGIQPAGLNADSEGVIRTFYDNISAYQEKLYRDKLTRVIDFVQLSEFGVVDPDITFDFRPLYALDEKGEADVRKTEAETDMVYVDGGVIGPEEVRVKIATDPNSPYHGLDPDDLPEPPADEGALAPGELPPDGGGGQPPSQPPPQPRGREVGKDAVIPFGVAADSEFVESEHPRAGDGKFAKGGGGGAGGGAGPLDVSKLEKVGGQKGSNPGGVYKDAAGGRFYVKEGKSPDHVKNEMLAASLYGMAGAPTLKYRPVAGGKHIATELADLDKTHSHQLSPAEIKRAQEDFAAHAWTGNWDAVGTGGDNLGTVGGVPTALDLGGALAYRAMGVPKGEAFGNAVGEFDTLRDPGVNAYSAKVFGKMTPDELRTSVAKVAKIGDQDIRDAVKGHGLPEAMADKLIARRDDLAKRAGLDKRPGTAPPPAATVLTKDAPSPHGGDYRQSGFGNLKEQGFKPRKRGKSGDITEAAQVAWGHAIETGKPQTLVPVFSGGFASSPGYQLLGKNKVAYGQPHVVVDPDGNVARYDIALKGGDEMIAADAFEESKHPRDQSGKFSTTGGGGGSGATPEKGMKQFGGLYKTSGATPKENHLLTAKWAADNKHLAHDRYRRTLNKLIKDTPKFGLPPGVSIEQLKQKLGAAYFDTAKNLGKKVEAAKSAGDLAKAKELSYLVDKAATKAKNLGWEAAVAPAEPGPGASAAMPVPPPPVVTNATPDELKKAAKTTAIPNTAKSAVAQDLIKDFNDQYAGKTITDPVKLASKVIAYKWTMEGVQKADAAWAAQTKAEREATSAKMAADLKAKAAAEAKAKAKAEANKQYMETLGINESQAEGFDALVNMLGVKGTTLANSFKKYADEAAQHGYQVSGFQAALIRNYTNGGYAAINRALRDKSWTTAQHVYVSMVNQALKKMPPVTGEVTRGTSLTASQQAKYKVGHVVLEDGFTSASISNPFGGNTRFSIKAIGKRCAHVKKLSNHPGEDEVVFAAHTFFKVTKIENGPGGKHIHMEEIEHEQ